MPVDIPPSVNVLDIKKAANQKKTKPLRHDLTIEDFFSQGA
jgi:hypothetical protein